MKNFETVLSEKKIFVTGHSGFTGCWTCLWLESIGSTIHGYSLRPMATPNLFDDMAKNNLGSTFADILIIKIYYLY